MGIHFGVDYYPEHWPRARLGDGRAADEGNGRTGRAHGRIFVV